MADLPNLKKKEKERKRAGAFWGGNAGRAAFEGAEGGLGAGAGAAGELGGELGSELAGELAGELGELGGELGEIGGEFAGEASVAGAAEDALTGGGWRALLARLASTFGGRLVLAGAALLVLGGALAAAAFLREWMAGRSTGPEGSLSLEAPDDLMHSHMPLRSRSLDYLHQAYRGEFKDGEDAAKDTKEAKDGKAADTADAKDAKDSKKDTSWKDVLSNTLDWRKDRLAHNLSMAKLSDSIGGGFTGNVFANSGAPKFGDGFDRSGLAKALPSKGTSKAIAKAVPSKGQAITGTRGIHSKRAIGQLRAANALSSDAAASPNEETARTMANDAFDGHGTQGGIAPSSPISMDNPTGGAGVGGTTPGGSMPGGGSLPGSVNPPSTQLPAPPDATPIPQGDYQPNVDAAKNLISQAASMKKKSIMMIIAGLALIAAGLACMPFGAALIAAGALLVGMGIMMAIMAGKLAKQAEQIGQQLQQAFGQEAQNNVIQTCAQQAANSGTECAQSVTDKQAPNLPVNNQLGAAGQAAQDENTGPDSGYTVDGNGAPITGH